MFFFFLGEYVVFLNLSIIGNYEENNFSIMGFVDYISLGY